jgi:hypothetical protein
MVFYCHPEWSHTEGGIWTDRTEATSRVNNVDPRTYWTAIDVCGPGATDPQISTMVRRLEALYAARPGARTLLELARRGGDLHRYMGMITEFQG